MTPVIIFLGFFVYSVSINIFGTLASTIMSTTALSLSQMGSLLSTLQTGAFLGILLSPLVLKRLKEASILRLGVVVMGLALGTLVFFPSKSLLFAMFACLGFGGFYVDSGSNAYLAGRFPDKRSTYIPILHFVYSVGALSSGFLILPFKGPSWHFGYAICGFLLLALLLVGLQRDKGFQKRQLEPQGQQENRRKLPVSVMLRDKRFLLYCLVLLLYMASQQTCTSWLPLYIETSFQATPSMVAATMLSFWVGIACMRLVAPLLLHRGWHPLVLTAGGMALSFVALCSALLSPNVAIAYGAIVLCGFGAGATIPLFIVEASSWFPANTAFVSVFYILCGTLGRMLVPYLVAIIAEAYSLKLALLLSSLLLLLGFLLSVNVYRAEKSSEKKQIYKANS